jgi:hypothetical protein
MGVRVRQNAARLATSVLAGLLLSAPLATVSADELSLYEAVYTTKVIGLSVTLNRSLTREGDRFHLSQAGKTFMLSLNEDSHFTLEGEQIIGEEFVYQLGGVSKRRREVHFDPANNTIRSLKKKEWTEHPWSPDVLDRLSQQEQMRLKLLLAETPPERISLSIIDGPRIKLKHFDLVETGSLETEVGTLNTVHYRLRHDDPSERSSDAWLATDHDFLMVRTEHVEDGSKTVIRLQSASVEGKPVTGH